MSKEQGILTKEKVKAKLPVKGADGKAKFSALAEGAFRTATPEQMKVAQNGGLTAYLMLLKNMDALAMNGSTRNVKDTEKAYEITMKAEKEVAFCKQTLRRVRGCIGR